MYVITTTEATTEPVTLAEVKDWLNIATTAKDSILTASIVASRKKVEQLTGRSLVARTLKLTINDYSETSIELPYPEINAITSVKSTDSEGTETTETDYTLVNNVLNFVGSGQSLAVTYTTKASTDEFYKLAIKKQIAYDYRNEFNENGFDREVIGMLQGVTLNTGF